jgi:hypothetical protein
MKPMEKTFDLICPISFKKSDRTLSLPKRMIYIFRKFQ